ncbi:hypothetical protein [Ruegeria atlantica]|uniref:Uncharacterized protein n=1 Tax=Ruegeria atlantica TaxID=81569 RepID=A0A0P1E338_9RHOB|nr:hypothetical protein [Ruegeria atlantica]CUH42767.1 hypothetical protein RUM4293_01656 [Ruegeria atlantica]
MIRSASVIEESSITTVVQTSGKVAVERLSTTTKSSSGRFPPIENALTEIVKNKRLFEEQNNV